MTGKVWVVAGVLVLIFSGGLVGRSVISNKIQSALRDRNVQAFLAMIGRLESPDGYFVLYGGGHFSDTSGHPNVRVPFVNKRRALHADGSPNDFSTAAGKYQINFPTWIQIQALAFLPDFTPASQDEAAVWLLYMRGVLPSILAGNFPEAVKLASGTWASLPGSTALQNPRSYQTALNVYVNHGGLQA